MPLWTSGEIDEAVKSLKYGKDDKYELRKTRYGNIPRAVLIDDVDNSKWGNVEYEDVVQEALNGIDFDADHRAITNRKNLFSGNIRHSILHVDCSTTEDDEKNIVYNFRQHYMTIASDEMNRLVIEEFVKNKIVDARSLFSQSSLQYDGTVCGPLFEDIAHCILRMNCGHQFEIKRFPDDKCADRKRAIGKSVEEENMLSSKKKKKLVRFSIFDRDGNNNSSNSPSCVGWTRFKSVNEAIKLVKDAVRERRVCYLRPESTQFPAIDSIAVTETGKIVFFQMTISPKHDITGERAAGALDSLAHEFLQLPNINVISLIFLVAPHSTYKNYGLPIIGGEDSNERYESLKRIQVYAMHLQLPLEQ